MRKILNVLIIFSLGLVLVACGGDKKEETPSVSYKDGTYHGESAKDERGGLVKVDITVKDNKIESCTMQNIDGDGKEKDESYGQSQNEGLYKIAQQAINLSKSYPDRLVEKGNPEGVDVISGATETYKQFIDACNNALDGAK
ncbi:FMN-binding protein [Lagierella sp. ICN-221743]